TGNTLDVGLQTPGQYFVIQQPDGTNLLTRDGEFYPSAQGDLVTSRGDQVLDDGQRPIHLPTNLQNIKIREDGTITQGGTEIAKILVVAPTQAELAQFPRATGALQPANGTQLRQGYLEASNVSAVTEMVSLIEASKLFNFEQKVVSAHDQMLQKATGEVGKTT
ncbi:MAG: flagellar basal-body rod protein FlgG, partial [Cyanobacteria bacterium REEB65]|nr:flagellar basal-body rod protein FlgG [Cyanobacteria bacterium REEB65]